MPKEFTSRFSATIDDYVSQFVLVYRADDLRSVAWSMRSQQES